MAHDPWPFFVGMPVMHQLMLKEAIQHAAQGVGGLWGNITGDIDEQADLLAKFVALQAAIDAVVPVDFPVSVRTYGAVLDGVTQGDSSLTAFLDAITTSGGLGLIPNGVLLTSNSFVYTLTEGEHVRAHGHDWESILDFSQTVGTGTGAGVISFTTGATIRWRDMSIREAGRLFSGNTASVGSEPRTAFIKANDLKISNSGAVIFDTSQTVGATISDSVSFDLQDMELATVSRGVFVGNTQQKAYHDSYLRGIRHDGSNRFHYGIGTTNPQAMSESHRLIMRDMWLDNLVLEQGSNSAHVWIHGREVSLDSIFLRGISGTATALAQSDKEGLYTKVAHLFARGLFLEDCGGDQGMLALKGHNREYRGIGTPGHDNVVQGFHINATGDRTVTDNMSGVWIQGSDMTLLDGVIEGMNSTDIRVHSGQNEEFGGVNNTHIERVKFRRFAGTQDQVRFRSQGYGGKLLHCTFEEQTAASINSHVIIVPSGTSEGYSQVEIGHNRFDPRFLGAGTEAVTSAILVQAEGGQTLTDVYIHDNKHSAAQTNGILFSGSNGTLNYIVIEREDFSALADATLAVANTTSGATLTNIYIRKCRGIVTENSGTATLANGTTSIVVAHGLTKLSGFDATPHRGDIIVNPIESWGSATKWWISAVDADDFTITVDVNPGADVDFAWSVRKEKWA